MSPTEKAIIEAALKLFSEKGFAATSIRDISNAANLTSASLYYYVDNKKDLLNRIMKTYLHKQIVSAEEVIAKCNEDDYERKIAELIKIHVRHHGNEQLAALVVDTEYRSLEGEDRKEVQSLRKRYESIWIDNLEKGESKKIFHFSDSKITAFALIGLCTGVAHWYRKDHRYSIDEIANQYIQLGLNMIKVQTN